MSEDQKELFDQLTDLLGLNVPKEGDICLADLADEWMISSTMLRNRLSSERPDVIYLATDGSRANYIDISKITLEEVRRIVLGEPIRDDDIYLVDYCKSLGIGYTTAKRRMRMAEKEGKIRLIRSYNFEKKARTLYIRILKKKD